MKPDSAPREAPWKKPRPKTTTRIKLTPASIARAKAAAKRAGRRYPNLIDNMAAARAQAAQEKKHSGEKETSKVKRTRKERP